MNRPLTTMKTITCASEAVHPEYSRILTAALVCKSFEKQLLDDPVQAVGNGFAGEMFHLSNDEWDCIRTIQAANLADFAAQLMRAPETSRVAFPVWVGCD
ncbi:MAG: hypothetical protein ABFD44_01760 [Anaerolineaceae bacterium]